MAWDRVVKHINSYIDKASFQKYCDDQKINITIYTNDDIQSMVIYATDYLNSLPYINRGDVIMQFPMNNERVMICNEWLAVYLLQNNGVKLYDDTISTSEKLKSKSLGNGAISKTWFTPAELGAAYKAGVRFDYIDNMLMDLLDYDTETVFVGMAI